MSSPVVCMFMAKIKGNGRLTSKMKENKSLEDLKCMDKELARDLISRMVQPKPEDRPTVDEVLKHPFFWSEKEKLSFLKNIVEESELNQSLIGVLDSIATDSWISKMDLTDYEKAEYPGIKKYEVIEFLKSEDEANYPETTSGLLKFIVDVSEQMEDVPELWWMQELFKDEKAVWEFFSVRFPSLFKDLVQIVKGDPQPWCEELRKQLEKGADKDLYKVLKIQKASDSASEKSGSIPSTSYQTGDYPSYSPW